MQRPTWAVSTTLVACCVLAAGCGGHSNQSAQSTPVDTTAAPAATSTSAGETVTPMTDANILAVMHEANTAEIGAAQTALKKASAASVKAFARRMIRDHRAMDAEGAQVAKAASITPQAAVSDTLPQHAEHETAQLDSTKGPAFDRAYMDDQVDDHQTVLSILQQAQTSAQNPQVKAAVDSAVGKVQQHLDLAKKVQGELKPTA
jgi:putative membrane protein